MSSNEAALIEQIQQLQSQLEAEKFEKQQLLSNPELLADESIREFNEKEAKLRQTLESMKTRLKEALDEKKDIEIEFLQLQKNFLKAKNEIKMLKENSSNNL